MFIVRYN